MRDEGERNLVGSRERERKISPSDDLKGKGREGSGPMTNTVSGLSKRA